MQITKTPQDNMIPKPMSITPESIVSQLFYFHDCSHLFHLQTSSYAKHKMLGDLYESLVDMKDNISEYLLGIQAPRRLGSVPMIQVPPYSDENVSKMIDEGFQFSIKLCEYADSKKLEQLCNLSSELQNLFVKSKYLNTLK